MCKARRWELSMKYEKLDRKAILSWRIGEIIRFILWGLIMAGGLIISKDMEAIEPYIKYAYIGVALLFTYMLLGIIIYPEIEYRQWRYMITEDKIEIRHGIFFLKTTIIPIIRVQHITMSRGPIYRKLGLTKVSIFLASGSFDIEGLNENTANMISENLKARVYERLNKED